MIIKDSSCRIYLVFLGFIFCTFRVAVIKTISAMVLLHRYDMHRSLFRDMVPPPCHKFKKVHATNLGQQFC